MKGTPPCPCHPKLEKLCALLDEKSRIDSEIAALLGETDKPQRGRPKNEKEKETTASADSPPEA